MTEELIDELAHAQAAWTTVWQRELTLIRALGVAANGAFVLKPAVLMAFDDRTTTYDLRRLPSGGPRELALALRACIDAHNKPLASETC